MIPFSNGARRLRSSEIRRLMKLAADPSIISFAGGMPAPELLPTEIVDELYGTLSTAEKQAALQYAPTAGYPPLLESLREYLRSRDLPLDGRGILVTTGAMQAINLLAAVTVDPGDTVLTESPSFIGALAAFKAHGAELTGVPLDNDGVELSALRRALRASPPPKLAYLTTHFHNPAGILYSPRRKREVLEAFAGTDVCVLEDDPYGELYFDESRADAMRPIAADAGSDTHLCYAGSFSKIFGPGIRLGWLLGPTEIVDKCELVKQSQDACSASLSQVLAHAFLSRGMMRRYLPPLRAAYARRAGIMLRALDAYTPGGMSWTRPEGGFYVWVTLEDGLDATAVFERALARGAAFVIGKAFDPGARRNSCFRLAFSHTGEERIDEGVRAICEAVRETRESG